MGDSYSCWTSRSSTECGGHWIWSWSFASVLVFTFQGPRKQVIQSPEINSSKVHSALKFGSLCVCDNDCILVPTAAVTALHVRATRCNDSKYPYNVEAPSCHYIQVGANGCTLPAKNASTELEIARAIQSKDSNCGIVTTCHG